jgi:histidinol-phosphate aminotransferase
MQHRRTWLKQTSFAALALGVNLKSFANEEGITRAFGSEHGLINLGANENPHGISPMAKQALLDMLPNANRYSFNLPSLQSVRKDLAAYYGLTEDNIIFSTGSGQALVMMGEYFTKGNLVTANPTFNLLPATAKKMGTEVIEIPLTDAKVHDLPKMMAAITDKTQTVYICNPANPTGTIVAPSVLKDFCREASKKAMVIVDEAYIDFLNPGDNESMMSLVSSNKNIIVVRTFSKIHGMAGLRVGFLVAHPDTVKKLLDANFEHAQFAISNLSIAAAMASLKDEQHRKNCKEKIVAAREYTQQALNGMGYKCIPSYTNFIFYNLNGYKGDYQKDMLAKNILLRAVKLPDAYWGRVSIGTMDEMKEFVKVMKG